LHQFLVGFNTAKVVLNHVAVDDLERLSNPIHGRVLKLLVKLERWPGVSGAKPLRGELVGRYRLRTGDYRIQFHVAGDAVTVEKIGHRDGFYGE
jgi:mRNA-degrading endonuclease RelE of RelBE toxin-antitoxin system